MCMTSDPYAAGYRFARSAFTGGPTRDQKAVRTIYIYISHNFTAFRFGFEMSAYTVLESDGEVEVCVTVDRGDGSEIYSATSPT